MKAAFLTSETENRMVRICYIEPGDVRREVELEIGQTLMQGAIANGVRGIVAECGGACVCATCHVYMDEGVLPALVPVSPTENEMLDAVAAERRPNSRLGCQIKASDALNGAIVRLPATQI